MKDNGRTATKHLDFIVFDILCVEVSFLLAYYIRFKSTKRFSKDDWELINVLVMMSHLVIVFMAESYSGILRRGYLKELKNVILHNAVIIGIVLAILFFIKSSDTYSRLTIGYFLVIDTVLMYLERVILKKFVYKRNSTTKRLRRLLLISRPENADMLMEKLLSFEYGGFVIDSVILTDGSRYENDAYDVKRDLTLDSMFEYALSNIVDGAILDGGLENKNELTDAFLEMGIAVHISMDTLLKDMPNPTLENLNKCAVLTTSINQMTFKQRFVKRTIDIVAGLVGTVFTVLLTIIFGPIIFIQSPGPIFFKQVRIGKNGRKFKMYKFRSMYLDAEERKKELMAQNEMQGLMFKMENDPRIIPIGRFMRKTSLDEFPQFLNILIGDMSLVGTRPPTVDEYNAYALHHKSRLAIKPGLTGMWQTSGRNDITDFEEVVKLDNYYIRHFCLSLDIKIILKTFGAVLKQEGSK